MSNEKLLDTLRSPHVSEKASRAQEQNQYVFEVASTATKQDVKAAVEHLFNVKVEGVQMVNIRGKRKTFRFRPGVRSDLRKAYVRLADGASIDLGASA
jgi:large subunit ribosomal protein L23